MPQEDNSLKSRRRVPNWLFAGIAIGLIIVCIGFLSPGSEPLLKYQGKSAARWFEACVQARQVNPNDLQSSCFAAFREMEGEAVEFLARWLGSHPGKHHELYAAVHRRLPSFLAGRVPAPKDQAYFRERQVTSLVLLKLIGQEQRFKAAEGNPSKKPSISIAVPEIIAHLRVDPSAAASVLWNIGPPAAPAVDELVVIASDSNSMASTMAIQAFRLIGPGASNAVPLLVSIAEDQSHRDRIHAVTSLGGMQQAAASAIPSLVTFLATTNQALRVAALRSLAEIGSTPEAAVQRLQELQRSTNEWEATLATLALWNREPQNQQLRDGLVAFLHTEKRGWLISVLSHTGTNAAPFKQFVEPFAVDADPNISHFAKKFLYVASQTAE